eukprot:gene6706-3376_t
MGSPRVCTDFDVITNLGTLLQRIRDALVRAGGPASALAAQLSESFSVPLVSWGAVAADISPLPDDAPEDTVSEIKPGQAFCFLPLPAKTGLPVQINGFFELSSNRRDVWHGSDMSGAGARRAHWNATLLEAAVGPAYVMVLVEATRLLGPTQAFFRLWPTTNVPQPWQGVVASLFSALRDQPVVWTYAVRPSAPSGGWASPMECLMPDAKVKGIPTLKAALEHAGVALNGMPLALLTMMDEHLPSKPSVVTPSIARAALLQGHYKGSSTAEAALLLDYVTQDLDLSEGAAHNVVSTLSGLQLLPLLDGSLAIFGARDEVELELLRSRATHLLIDTHLLTDDVTAKLLMVAELACLNISNISARDMAHTLLPLVLPQVPRPPAAGPRHLGPTLSWKEAGEETQGETAVTREWLLLLWQWIREHGAESSLKEFLSLPVLPVQGRGLCPLIARQYTTAIIDTSALNTGRPTPAEGDDASSALKSALQLLGCQLVDTATFQLPVSEILALGYALPMTGAGALGALVGGGLAGAPDKDVWCRMMEPLSAAHRTALRHTLLQAASLKEVLSKSDGASLLASLAGMPIYLAPSRVKGSQRGARAAPAQHTMGIISTETTDSLNADPLAVSAPPLGPGPSLDAGHPASEEVQHFINVASPCFAAPFGFDMAIVLGPHSAPSGPPKFVCGDSDAQQQLLTSFLGVVAVSEVEVFKQYVLSRLASLAVQQRNAALRYMLSQLSRLNQQDPNFTHLVAATSFLPNEKGDLHRPNELYDPRVPELAALLDPEAAFPSPDFYLGPVDATQEVAVDFGLASDDILHALQQLGLRSPGRLTDEVNSYELMMQEQQRLRQRSGAATSAVQPGGGLSRGLGAASAALGAFGRKTGFGLFSKVSELLNQGPGGSDLDGGQPGGGDGGGGGSREVAAQAVQKFWTEISQICWCPVVSEPPVTGLPWAKTSPRLALPTLVRPSSDMWLVSSSMFILDGECRSSALAAGLGWASPIGGGVLAHQLLQLGLTHSHVDKPDTAKLLASVVPQMYRVLSKLKPTEFGIACSLLHGSCCVWVGNGFASANKVAFRGTLDLSPWLFVLPSDLSPFRDLLLKFGATEEFSAQQYTSLLSDMYAHSCGQAGRADVGVGVDVGGTALQATPTADALVAGGSPESPDPEQGKPSRSATRLNPNQLAQAIAVVQALADISFSARAPPGPPKSTTIFVPDEHGLLCPAADLAYDDAPWLGQDLGGFGLASQVPGPPTPFHSSTTLGHVKRVHPNISTLVAERVGVCSLRQLLIAHSSDSMSLGLVGPSASEAFGQSEALTTRLRHIIGDYPEGFGIMMELLQNADDAGATGNGSSPPLNRPSYPTSSILGPAMATWQGPALLAHNDAVFSPMDFQSISRIGQDSNFVSGDHLVLFDPHAKYLPGVNPAQPGLKIAFQRSNLLSQFPDAFNPYLFFGCTLQENYAGTLFRFPLRGVEAAANSDIKAVPCSTQDVLNLLDAFRAQLPHALLFLKSVRKVSVFFKERVEGGGVEGNEPALMFEAEAVGASAASLQDPVSRFVTADGGSSDLSRFFARLARTKAAQLPCEVGSVVLSMRGGPAGQPPPTSSGGLPPAQQQRWMVCNALAAGSARDMAVAGFGSSESKRVPWVGVAAMVPGDGRDEINRGGSGSGSGNGSSAGAVGGCLTALGAAASSGGSITASASPSGPGTAAAGGSPGDQQVVGRAYCFLPLPISTGLPLHVNAYFELSSNRRDVWHGADLAGKGAERAQWNYALLKDGLAPACSKLLLEMSAITGPSDSFFSIFPVLADVAEPWVQMSRAFYAQLSDKCLIWTDAQGGRWLTPCQVIFADEACARQPGLKSLLVALGMPLACRMPRDLELAIVQLTAGANTLSPALVRRHIHDLAQKLGPSTSLSSSHLASILLSKQSDHQLGPTQNTDFRSGGGESQNQPAPVAVVLQYCLSDLDPSTAQGLRSVSELNGLPLLPLGNSTLGTFHTSGAGGAQLQLPASFLLPEGELEISLLAPVGHFILDSFVLGKVLPPAWHKASEVQWDPVDDPPLTQLSETNASSATAGSIPLPEHNLASQASSSPAPPQPGAVQRQPVNGIHTLSVRWLVLLWQWLSTQSATDMHQLISWPLIPAQGGRLCQLQPQSTVLCEGSWTEGALASARARSQPPSQAPSQAPSQLPSLTPPGPTSAVPAWQGSWGSRLASLEPVERRQLRAYMLQGKWFQLVSETGVSVRDGTGAGQQGEAIPFYEVYASVVPNSPTAAAGGTTTSPSHPAASLDAAVQSSSSPRPGAPDGATAHGVYGVKAGNEQSFVTLDGAHGEKMLAAEGVDEKLLSQAFLRASFTLDGAHGKKMLAAEGVDEKLLSQAFLRCESPVEGMVLEKCLDHVLPRGSAIPQAAIVDLAVMLCQRLLQHSTHASMSQDDKRLSWPLIPNLSGQLCAPQDLFDPRITKLRAILEPLSSFPAAPFDDSSDAGPASSARGSETRPGRGSGTFGRTGLSSLFGNLASNVVGPPPSNSLLDALALLGMRTTVDLDMLAAAADSLARSFADLGSPAAPAPAPPGAPKSSETIARNTIETSAETTELQPGYAPQDRQETSYQGQEGSTTTGCTSPPQVPQASPTPETWDPFASSASSPNTVPPRVTNSTGDPPTPRGTHPNTPDHSTGFTNGDTTGDAHGTRAEAIAAAGSQREAAPPNSTPREGSQGEAANNKAEREHILLLRSRALLRELKAWAEEHPAPTSPKELQAVACLGSASWCPVLGTAPEHGMPWHPRQPMLAPPRMCRPKQDAWLVSATMCVLDAELASDSPLSQLLDWNVALRASVLAAQLLELGKLHPKVDPNNQGLAASLSTAVHQLYRLLTDGLDGKEGDLIQMSLGGATDACVWTGSGLAPSSMVAFESAGDFKPYLFGVPPDFQQYRRFLSTIGVKDYLSLQHYAVGLRELSRLAPGQPLSEAQLAVALQFAELAAEAQKQYGRSGAAPLVPDSDTYLMPADELFFNDADWLDMTGMRFVHPAMPHWTAESLGVRSLRYHHEVDTQLTHSLPCPSQHQLKERLSQGGDTPLSFLYDLLEVADLLGAKRLDLVLDMRPALCVVLPDVSVSAEELSDLLNPRSNLPLVKGRPAVFCGGLQSIFSVSELPQAISGGFTLMWDPSGRQLAQSADSVDVAPRAKLYRHADSDLITNFSDQFSPWDFAGEGVDVSKPVGLTLLRLPLIASAPVRAGGAGRGGLTSQASTGPMGARLEGAAGKGGHTSLADAGSLGASLEEVQEALSRFRQEASRSLLFLRKLQSLAIRHIPPTSTNTSQAGVGVQTETTVPPAPAAPAGSTLTRVDPNESGSGPPRVAPPLPMEVEPNPSNLPPSAIPPSANPLSTHPPSANPPQPLKLPPPLWQAALSYEPDFPRHDFGSVTNPSAAPQGPRGGLAKIGGLWNSALGKIGAGARGAGGTVRHVVQLQLLVAESDASGAVLDPRQESWLVSTVWDEGGHMSSASGSHAFDAHGGGPATRGVASLDVMGSVALCVGTSSRQNMLLPVLELSKQIPAASVSLPLASTTAPKASTAAGAGKGQGGAQLSRLPFMLSGKFHLSRAHGRHITQIFGGSGSASHAFPNNPNAQLQLGTPLHPPSGASQAFTTNHMLAYVERLEEHNRKVLEAISQAWVVALQELVGSVVGGGSQSPAVGGSARQLYISNRDRLYDLMPDMDAAVKSGDELAVYCIRQMYHSMSKLPLWRLRTGRYTFLQEGCFLQFSQQEGTGLGAMHQGVPISNSLPAASTGDMSHRPHTAEPANASMQQQQQKQKQMGDTAMAFMQRQMPLFDVPWRVKLWMEACDIHGLKTLTPAVARPLLKDLVRRANMHQQPLNTTLSLVEATQLLHFCFSDLQVIPDPSPYPQGLAAPLPGRADPAPARAGPGGEETTGGMPLLPSAPLGFDAAHFREWQQHGASVLNSAASGLSGLFNSVGRALEPGQHTPLPGSDPHHSLPHHPAHHPGGQGGAQPGQRGVGGGFFDIGTNEMAAAVAAALGPLPGSATQGAASATHPSATTLLVSDLLPPHFPGPTPPLGPEYNMDRVRECRGLPIPTVAGTIVPLGSTPLLLTPTQCGSAGPATLLPPRHAHSFVHPDTVSELESLLKDKNLRSALNLKLYSLEDLSNHLAEILPPAWHQPRIVLPGADEVQDHASSSGRPRLGTRIADVFRPLRAGALSSLGGRGSQADFHSHPPHGTVQASGRQGHVPEASGVSALGVAWQNGSLEDGPSPWWLAKLWSIIKGLKAAASEWGEEAMLTQLDGWPLLPSIDGQLIWMAYRSLLIALPLPRPPKTADRAQLVRSTTPGSATGEAASADLAAGKDELARGKNELASIGPHSAPVGPGDLELSPPWDFLIPALMQCSCPVLDPRFCALLEDECEPSVQLRPTGTRASVLQLLTDNVPRALSEDQVLFLRLLPVYCLYQGPASSPAAAGGSGGGACGNGASSSIAVRGAGGEMLVGGDGGGERSHRYVALTSDDFYACPSNVAERIPGLVEGLPAEVTVRLLTHHPSLDPLYQVLTVPILTLAKLIASYALPSFQHLDNVRQLALLTHVQSAWGQLKEDPELVASMKACRFVLAADDKLYYPSELYDPGVQLYSAVFQGQPVFPHGQYAFPSWLEILRDCGLRHSVDTATFLECALQVERQGAVLSDPTSSSAEQAAVLKAAGALVSHLQSNCHTLLGREFYTSLGHIACVPSTLGIPGSFKVKKVLAKYSEAAALKDWALCWTVLPVVDTRHTLPSSVASHLRLRSPPPFPVILQHLRNVGEDGGEEVLGSWPEAAAGRVETVFGAILQHLHKEGLSPSQQAQVKNVAFIPVANAIRLVPPTSLFIRLRDDLSPFAYELPPSLSAHLELLKELGAKDEPPMQLLEELGAKDEPPMQALLDALHQLQHSAGHTALNANQCYAVVSLLGYLATRRNTADVAWLQTAIARDGVLLLSAGARLIAPRRSVYVAAGGSRLLGRIDTTRLTFVHPQISESVATWLGCLALQDTVEEVIDTHHVLMPVDMVGNLHIDQVRQLLRSTHFISAAYTVLQAHSHTVRGLTALSLQQVAARMRAAESRLTFVQSLSTRVVLKADPSQDITKAGDSHAAEVFEFTCSRSNRIYIAQPPANLPAAWLLSQAMSRVLDSPITLPLQPFFSCPPHEMQKLQPVLLPGGYDLTLERAGQTGQLGAPLLPSDAMLLQLKPLKRYCVGELVALPREAVGLESVRTPSAAEAFPIAAYCVGELVAVPREAVGLESVRTPSAAEAAAIAAERRATTTTTTAATTTATTSISTASQATPSTDEAHSESAPLLGRAGWSDDVAPSAGLHSDAAPPIGAALPVDAAPQEEVENSNLVYARIAANCAPTEGQPVYRIAIQIGEDGGANSIVQLISTKVYSFRNASSAAASATAAPSPPSASLPTPQRHAPPSSHLPSNPQPGAKPPSGGGPVGTMEGFRGSQPPSGGQGRSGAVGSSELANAVRDLLGSAGLPLDLERGELLDQAASLREALRAAEAQLKEVKETSAAQEQELESARTAWQCKVCMAADVECSYIGCGHMLCGGCASSLDRCPVCRKRSQLLRVFK